ncbi:MAG: alanyl-tRNA editing protein [Alphaproteobacteria bacterium]
MTKRTEELFRDDSYLTECEATVTDVNERGGIVLDRTVFYYTGGGQPGDKGTLMAKDGTVVEIGTTINAGGDIVHVPASEDQPALSVGAAVTGKIDWDTRYRHMQMHTAMHLICALVPCAITGCQIGAEKSRIDFNPDGLEDALDKDSLTDSLNELAGRDIPLGADWISDADLDANPDLVRTMSVQPPRGLGKVRLIRIGDPDAETAVDLQPCGGTHVARTGEIKPLRIAKIENKGKNNRRINIVFEG